MKINAINDLKLWNTNKSLWNSEKDLNKVILILEDSYKFSKITNLKRIGIASFELNAINKNRNFGGY